jgi:hypothetical protein
MNNWGFIRIIHLLELDPFNHASADDIIKWCDKYSSISFFKEGV